MNKNKRIKTALAFAVTVLISAGLLLPQHFAFAAEAPGEQAVPAAVQEDRSRDYGTEDAQPCTTSISSISSRGAVNLALSPEELEDSGYRTGDLVKIAIGDRDEIILPFIEGYSSIGFHRPMLSSSIRDMSHPDRILALRMSEGNFAEAYGITEDDAGLEVVISMEEQGGFLDEYNKWQIGRMSRNRDDFPDLSDEEFANYRVVSTTGIKEGVLYRTSSPVNPMIGRSRIADEANRRNGVTTIINLSESPESVVKREGYDESYYKTVSHFEADMGTDFGSDTFNSKLAACMRFMTDNPGVYEVNCIFGKDRTGFMIAVLEGLMGASYSEIIDDYAATYPHYYPEYNSYEPIAERDRTIAEGNLIAQMEYAYGIDDLQNADIQAATESYLRKIGLDSEEIRILKRCLAGEKICSIKKVSAGSVTYNGRPQGPKVTFEGRVLRENIDYKWEKSVISNKYTDAGKYKATLTGMGMFYGSTAVQYKIVPAAAVPAVRLSNDAYTYTGKAIKPAVTVSVSGKLLDPSGYRVTYALGRKNVGSYKVTVVLKGNYSGSNAVYFRIDPAGTNITCLRGGRKAITVKWKRQTARMSLLHIDGYQIDTACNSSFTKDRRTVNVKGYLKASERITKLKDGRKYYVRIRTYKKTGTKTYYSPWSKVLAVKTAGKK